MPYKDDDATGQAKSTKRSLIDEDRIAQIPLDEIIVQEPRRNIGKDSDSSKNLKMSIRAIGVLEPVLVKQDNNGNYLLISGERRLQACKDLGLMTIPARIFSDSLSNEDILLIQITENLQRDDLDPIAEAECYKEYFRITLGCIQLDDVINALVLHTHKSKRLGNEMVENISTMEQLTGKTSRTIQNLISLLKLPIDAQKAIADGTISLSQGYILYKYIHHSRFETVLQERLKHDKMTNVKLISSFEDSGNTKYEEELSPYHEQLKRMKRRIEKENIRFEGISKESWLKEIDALRTFAQSNE